MARELTDEEIIRAVEHYKPLRGRGTQANTLMFGGCSRTWGSGWG